MRVLAILAAGVSILGARAAAAQPYAITTPDGWVFKEGDERTGKFTHPATGLFVAYERKQADGATCRRSTNEVPVPAGSGTWTVAARFPDDEAAGGAGLSLCREYVETYSWSSGPPNPALLKVLIFLRGPDPIDLAALSPEVSDAIASLALALSTGVDARFPQPAPTTFEQPAHVPSVYVQPAPTPRADVTQAAPPRPPRKRIGVDLAVAVRGLEGEGVFGDDKMGVAAGLAHTRTLRPSGGGVPADVIGGLAGELGYSGMGIDFDAQARAGLRVGHAAQLTALAVAGADAIDVAADAAATESRHMPPGVYGGGGARLGAASGKLALGLEAVWTLRLGDVVDGERRITGSIGWGDLDLGVRHAVYNLDGALQAKVVSLVFGYHL